MMDTQTRVLLAIAAHITAHGYAPTIQDLRDAASLASKSHVVYHLARLEDAGYITRQPGKARTLRLTHAGWQRVREMTREEQVA